MATLPISLMVIGTAASTILASWTMSRVGRAHGFACGAGVGCLGAALAVLALFRADFLWFCLASLLIGAASAFAQQYRFAAAESVSSASVGAAVSITLAGSLIGAVFGPWLAAHGEHWFEEARFAGAFAAVAGCYFFAALVLVRLRGPDASAQQLSAPCGRPLREISANQVFIVAVLGSAVGWGVMSFVMTAAPLAMHVSDSHPLDQTARVIQAHVIAMYGPSLVSGILLKRLRSESLMLFGSLILCVTVAAGFAGREILHYGIAMVALGIGWNFLFVGGTTLLATCHSVDERFRVQAANDFVVFGLSAAGSLAAGMVLQAYGWEAVLWTSFPLITLKIALLLAVRRTSSRG